MSNSCAFCGESGVVATRVSVALGHGDVSVTVNGVPAARCSACGETQVPGRVALAIDRAVTDILVATGEQPLPRPGDDHVDVRELLSHSVER